MVFLSPRSSCAQTSANKTKIALAEHSAIFFCGHRGQCGLSGHSLQIATRIIITR